MAAKPFKGSNVFMSRNLVPPEVFDTLLDALKLNGAEVFLCCDPSRNGPNDVHIISSSDHEKFEVLKTKGCILVGPQCVLSCAKERRALPKQQFTCCLAMDGVKVLASGFDTEERAELGKLVASMGGALHSKAALDVNFVLVKAVSAAKYQWAAHFKKPIVTVNWLFQCWNEHRLVSHKSYQVPPFFGLIICVTRIPAEERKEMEKLIIQNGGRYSAELTRTCTHLIFPQGDKFKVARKWGHIPVVTRKWFDQSIARRVCLKEEEYQVPSSSANSCIKAKHSQGKIVGSSLSAPLSVAADSHIPSASSVGVVDSDLEVISQKLFGVISDNSVSVREEADMAPFGQKNDEKLDGCVADDSQSDVDDLYLSDCRICLVGFDASNMRKLVNIVRKGGGSRYMSYNERLTHIVVGAPSDVSGKEMVDWKVIFCFPNAFAELLNSAKLDTLDPFFRCICHTCVTNINHKFREKKELRGLAALGVIHVVKALWLEDCDCARKEVPVMQRHAAFDILLPKDLSGLMSKRSAVGMNSVKQDSVIAMPHCVSADTATAGFTRTEVLTDDTRGSKGNGDINLRCDLKGKGGSSPLIPASASRGRRRNEQKIEQHVSSVASQDEKPSSIFMGRMFCFSDVFPVDRRDEVVQWIHQGGGVVVNNQIRDKVDFTVECHGVAPQASGSAQTAYVSSHWIRCCLEDGCLLDVASHMLFSPLPCQVPLPGFKVFRFSVSQYEDKDRLLLRNLSFILGAKFGEKLTKKVTHLLCKFASGPKYEAACRWGIPSVTCEWIYECVRKNEVVALDPYHPIEASTQNEAGLCTVSQYPTQANRMICGDDSSQLLSRSMDLTKSRTENEGIQDGGGEGESKNPSCSNKRARLFGNHCAKDVLSLYQNNTSLQTSAEKCPVETVKENTHAVPDVATAIEDLLEETSKIHDSKRPEETECTKTIFSSDCLTLGANHSDSHTNFGMSKNWLSRIEKKDEPCQPSGDQRPSFYDGFSETQTESQLVGYEEDLSGRQMIIDRVRTRSSAT